MSEIKIPGMAKRPGHEDLCMAFNTLVARDVRDMLLSSGVAEKSAVEIAEKAAFAVATVFDAGTVHGAGEQFRPRLSFVDAKGSALPVEGSFDLHDYAAGVLQFDDYE
ncbi:MAG: hypothetical protein AAF565_06855 [Pseudomonadota bacterium]